MGGVGDIPLLPILTNQEVTEVLGAQEEKGGRELDCFSSKSCGKRKKTEEGRRTGGKDPQVPLCPLGR